MKRADSTQKEKVGSGETSHRGLSVSSMFYNNPDVEQVSMFRNTRAIPDIFEVRTCFDMQSYIEAHEEEWTFVNSPAQFSEELYAGSHAFRYRGYMSPNDAREISAILEELHTNERKDLKFSGPCVKFLSLREVHINSATLEILLKGLEHQRSLQLLDLHDNKLSNSGCRVLSTYLPNFLSITDLILSKCKISDRGLSMLCPALSSCKALDGLVLESNQITGKGVEPLAGLVTAVELKSLILSNNKLGETGSLALTDILRHGSRCSLETLVVAQARLGDESGVGFCDAITSNSKIRHLDISDNNLTDESIKHIGLALLRRRAIISDYDNMEELSLFTHANPISDEVQSLLDHALEERHPAIYRLGDGLRFYSKARFLTLTNDGCNMIARDTQRLPRDERKHLLRALLCTVGKEVPLFEMLINRYLLQDTDDDQGYRHLLEVFIKACPAILDQKPTDNRTKTFGRILLGQDYERE